MEGKALSGTWLPRLVGAELTALDTKPVVGNRIRIRVHDKQGARMTMPGLPDWQWVSEPVHRLG